MLHDILGHDHIQWHPQLIRHYSNLRTYYRTGLFFYRFWPYYQILEVSIEQPTEDADSSGHVVLSHLGLKFVLMLRPFFPELAMSTDLLSFEHPSVLLFCLTNKLMIIILIQTCIIYLIRYAAVILIWSQSVQTYANNRTLLGEKLWRIAGSKKQLLDQCPSTVKRCKWKNVTGP